MLITNHSQLREPQPHSTAYKLIEGIWRRLYPQNDLDEEGEMGALLSAKPGRGLGGGIDCDGSFRKRGTRGAVPDIHRRGGPMSLAFASDLPVPTD
jgi:hypothetical protein